MSNSIEYVKHIKCDVIKSNIQCIIKFKIFNKALKSHNRNRQLIPSKSIGYSFIHNDSNYFSLIKKKKKKEYNFKGEKSTIFFFEKRRIIV